MIDENLPKSLVEIAQTYGFSARSIPQINPGELDKDIKEHIKESGEILVTRDIVFANDLFHSMAENRSLAGVILIREHLGNIIRDIWKEYLLDPFPLRGIVILKRNSTRFRSVHSLDLEDNLDNELKE